MSDSDSINLYIDPLSFPFEITDDGFRRLVGTDINMPHEYREIYNELDGLYNVRKNGHVEMLTLDEAETSQFVQYFVNQSEFEIDIERGIHTLQDRQERFKNLQAFLLDPKTRNFMKMYLVTKQSLLYQFKEVEGASTNLLIKINEVLNE